MITNEVDNATIELNKAQTKQTNITTLLNVATLLGQEIVQEQVCAELDLDYEDIKDKLPKQETIDINAASEELANVNPIEEEQEEVPTE